MIRNNINLVLKKLSLCGGSEWESKKSGFLQVVLNL